jgi:hypothetical protein
MKFTCILCALYCSYFSSIIHHVIKLLSYHMHLGFLSIGYLKTRYSVHVTLVNLCTTCSGIMHLTLSCEVHHFRIVPFG